MLRLARLASGSSKSNTNIDMIAFYSHSKIDAHKWDACIDACAYANATLRYAYLECVCNGAWSAIVQADINGDYVAVMPVFVALKYKVFRAVLQPPLLQQSGVYSRSNCADYEQFFRLLSRRFFWIDIKVNAMYLPNTGFKITPQSNYIIDLNTSKETLKSAYNSRFRTNINKFEKTDKSMRDVSPAQFMELIHENNRYKLPFKNYFQLIEKMLQSNLGKALGLFDRTQCLAVMYVIAGNATHVNLLNASSSAGLEQQALPYLLHLYMQQYCETTAVFDFEGSMHPGIAQLYRNYGSANAQYYKIKKWGWW
jgi:hypothetical protein